MVGTDCAIASHAKPSGLCNYAIADRRYLEPFNIIYFVELQ